MEKNSNLGLTVCSVEFISANDVSSIAEGTTENQRTVTPKSGKAFSDIYGSPSKFSFNENLKSSAAGVYYEQIVALSFPGDDMANINEFEALTTKRFVVKILFNNGTARLIGDLLSPAILKINYDLDKGGRVCQFECSSIKPAYYFEN